jgi:hypothetical protein
VSMIITINIGVRIACPVDRMPGYDQTNGQGEHLHDFLSDGVQGVSQKKRKPARQNTWGSNRLNLLRVIK